MSETPFFSLFFFFSLLFKVDPADFHSISKELFTRIISDISSAISQLVPRGILRHRRFFSPWLNEPECATASCCCYTAESHYSRNGRNSVRGKLSFLYSQQTELLRVSCLKIFFPFGLCSPLLRSIFSIALVTFATSTTART